MPLFHTTRGEVVESIHFGAIAIVEPSGALFAWYGDPALVTFLRSSAKPFQAIPLVEMGGIDQFQMTGDELAITCASHSGTDIHLKTIHNLQQKIGITESDLLCGTHEPFDLASRALLRDQGKRPSQNHHNCSGKHTGMLGQAKLLRVDPEGYTEPDHPVQIQIRSTFAEMCEMETAHIQIGRDGCSVPTFAVPLCNAAWGWAHLASPENLPKTRRAACQQITTAMRKYPFYLAGPGRLDTRLIQIGAGRLISKAGAEAFQAAGIFKDAIAPGSPALGIAIKISDGDQANRARRAVLIEVLRQLGMLTTEQLLQLGDIGPILEIKNQRQITTGEGKPCFQLQFS